MAAGTPNQHLTTNEQQSGSNKESSHTHLGQSVLVSLHNFKEGVRMFIHKSSPLGLDNPGQACGRPFLRKKMHLMSRNYTVSPSKRPLI
jgi:hypothetical protein